MTIFSDEMVAHLPRVEECHQAYYWMFTSSQAFDFSFFKPFLVSLSLESLAPRPGVSLVLHYNSEPSVFVVNCYL